MKIKRQMWGMVHALPEAICILLWITVPVYSLVPSGFDSAKTYSYPDSANVAHLCLMCPPGMYKTRDCTSMDSVDHCEPCPADTFKYSYDQATSCQLCKTQCFDHYEIIVAPCNVTHDLVCECKPGLYRDGEVCYSHRQCPVGQGVSRRGTKDEDTKCVACVIGETYSDIPSLNDSCKECVIPTCNISYRVTNCTTSSNSICTKDSDIQHGNPPDSSLTGWKIVLITVGSFGAVIFAAVCLVIYVKQKLKSTPENTPCNGTDQPPNSPLLPVTTESQHCQRQIFELIKNKIGIDSWKPFVRALPGNQLTDPELDRIINDHRHSVNDQIYEALRRHQAKNKNFLFDLYVQTLEECQLKSLAGELRDLLRKYPSIKYHDGEIDSIPAEGKRLHCN